MDQTREERMRSRMRGAARHQVQNADFGDLFSIPGIAPAPAPEAEPQPEPEHESSEPAVPSPEAVVEPPATSLVQRTNPNTSAKRRRLESEGTAVPGPGPHSPTQPPAAQSSSSSRRSQRLSRSPPANNDPYDLANAPVLPDDDDAARKPTPPTRRATTRRAPGSRSAAPRSAAQSAPVQSSPLPAAQIAEEVGESPADQPGSGQRRRVRPTNTITSSALLQSALRADDDGTADRLMQSSSPLSRKSRKSIAETAASRTSTGTSVRRSARLSGSSDDVNELSSDMLQPVGEASAGGVPAEDAPEDIEMAEIEESIIDQPGPDEPAEDEAAEEVDDREAARRLGGKRQRRSLPAASPELSSELSSEGVTEEPNPKRPRRPPPPKPKKRSPAKQKQPRAPRAKPSKAAPTRKRKAGDSSGPPISVKIQRFVRPRHIDEDDAEADDVLNTEIPFTDRSGVNAVDVLAQMCEEIINVSLNGLNETLGNAQDAPTKKELRTKISALRAFQEELKTRLLEHTIALDTLHALKRRVREAQKAKLRLRERIIQIRAEREQVALRMDAVRVKHEEDSKEAMHNINVSSAMHDIDLAIEQGRGAPELSSKDQKLADLSNLELLISRVTEQACSAGPRGGVLDQIKGFNAFLERAAAAL